MRVVKSYCHLPFTRVRVADDGGINFCCYQGSRYIGNLCNQSFEEIWNSDLSKQIKESVKGNSLHSMCSNKECPKYYSNLDIKYDNIVNDNFYPNTLEFSLHSTHCNYGGKNPNRKKVCIMCPRSDINFINRIKNVPDNTFLFLNNLKDLFPHLNHLIILGVSEIFWEDKIFEIFDYIDFEKYKKNILFESITNGSLFDEEKQIKFLERVDKSFLSFSLDCAKAKTYKQIRKNNYFDTVIKNIESYVKKVDEINKLYGEEKHTVCINANVNMLNIGEMPELIKLAKKLGVKIVIMWPTHDADGCNVMLNKEFMVNETNYKLFKKVEADCKKIAEELQIKLEIIIPFDLNLSV